MKRANIAELKNRLSHYIERVKRGETILVMDRKTPVARIVPVPPPGEMGDEETESWLHDMEVKGILRAGTRKGVREILARPPAGLKHVDVVSALIEERRRR